MGANKLGPGSRDAISLLPNEVLGDILSLVPTKLAASTCVLSKRWRNVFALVHNLDFNDCILLQPGKVRPEGHVLRATFKKFVDRTLALQGASPNKKFSLKFHILEESEMAYTDRWICNAVKRGVLEMYLGIEFSRETCLPSELFTSKTLVKLTLGTKIYLGKIPPDVYLPALKSLFIETIYFYPVEDLSYVLLSGCPVLEELSVNHEEFIGIPYCISSRTIKKLSVCNDTESEIFCMPGMSFEAPNLVSLDYSDYALQEYPQVNLESLVEARLDIRYSERITTPDLTNLIIGISNIQTLHLSPASAHVISRCLKHGLVLPVFNNLVTLSFRGYKKRGWRLLPSLIKKSPKLETLIIQGLDGYAGDVTMRVLQVVPDLGGTVKELVQLEIAQGAMVDDGRILQSSGDVMTVVKVATYADSE